MHPYNKQSGFLFNVTCGIALKNDWETQGGRH